MMISALESCHETQLATADFRSDIFWPQPRANLQEQAYGV
jgi:hypothetical protein